MEKTIEPEKSESIDAVVAPKTPQMPETQKEKQLQAIGSTFQSMQVPFSAINKKPDGFIPGLWATIQNREAEMAIKKTPEELAACEPEINLIKDNAGVIKSIVVRCSCGQTIEIACQYKQ